MYSYCNFKIGLHLRFKIVANSWKLFPFQTILSYMGEEKLQTFINYALKCLSEIKLPAKRGNFVEFRTGLLNICPVGRSCSQEERDAFGEYDKVHNIRGKLVESFKKEFPDFGLNYVIGKLTKSQFSKGTIFTLSRSRGFKQTQFTVKSFIWTKV